MFLLQKMENKRKYKGEKLPRIFPLILGHGQWCAASDAK